MNTYISGCDRTSELVAFANSIGLERATSGRHSVLLLIDIFVRSRIIGDTDPYRIVDEISYLEGASKCTSTKSPSVFTRPNLAGLWHKHYLKSGLASMARNLKNALNKFGLPSVEEMLQASQKSGEDHYLTEDDIGKIAHDAVIGNYERRAQARQMTGEWIIYARYEDKNYYLCLGDHGTGDEIIRERINSVCLTEFPFIAGILGLNDQIGSEPTGANAI